MNGRDELLRRVSAANPFTASQPLPDDVADARPPLALLITEEIPMDTLTKPRPLTPVAKRWRGPAIALGAALAVLLVAVPLLLIAADEELDPLLPVADPGTHEVEVTRGLVYHADPLVRGGEGKIDVYAPSGGGPWPVLVGFHGDPRFTGREWLRPMATAVADRGRVVFAPTWGRVTDDAQQGLTQTELFDRNVQELVCAVLYAQSHAAEYGGDPEHITVFGYSAGGNAALMAGLAAADPLAECSVDGPQVTPQAVVSMEGDVLLGDGTWDSAFAEDPEAFYSFTPWRHLDGSHDFPVVFMVAEFVYGPYDRRLTTPSGDSLLADRHIDVDLTAELTAMNLLEDGGFSLRDSQEWAYQTFVEAGYDTAFFLLRGSRHASLGDDRWGMSNEAWDRAVETLVAAEAATGTVSITIEGWEGVEGYRLLAAVADPWLNGAQFAPGAAFWVVIDSDPFTATDVVHPAAWLGPDSDFDDWAAGDYLWDLTAHLNPGKYQLHVWANPGRLLPYGSHLPSGPIERTCIFNIDVKAGEVTDVVIAGAPNGDDTCPVIAS